MDEHVRLVVSLVTYHSNIDLLTKAVDSLQGQCDNMVLFIVDNASDASYQQQLTAFEDRATVIYAPRNGGYGYGHNIAMLQAPPSDYFLVLNPDVIVHDDALEQLMECIQHRNKAGLAVPKVFYPSGELQPLNKREPNVLDLACRLLLPPVATELSWVKARLNRYSMLDKGYEHSYPLEFASGCCMMFKRSILTRLGGFDEKFFLYFEDADMTKRVNEIATAWYCSDANITHSWQRGSRSSFKLLRVMLQSAARYFAKWGVKWW